ncbi:AEC family transporter [Lactobacillus ultunensis]|uniref:Transporter, auxin efflux carrier (AEC) family protein n=1 Tax=Lactobacillus ultunensis DSM 16047 TaxID=525365 RepID=C2ER17_9LACO|nr:AEC family transporter [Lactobacillus ultunensis]EEJ71002.1 transporter, auxin efflux carrier (AEC) family protein [Lactobacillus ultunensis DSM 16047]QQP28936.1 AEC family transporter [Lactobacillus ultunensis]
MVTILVNDIVPILVIMLLGYVCGKFTFFDNDQRQGLNKLVLNIALPAALFISIVKATRKMFAQDIVLTLISLIGVTGLFMLSYYLDKLMFHRSTQEAAVCAMIAGSPTIGFLGFAVLDPIYGNNATTNLVIGIVSIVVNAVTIPLGLSLINKGQNVLKKKVSAKKNNGSTQVEVKLNQKGTTVPKTKKVTVPDDVPVSDEEAKALSEKGIQREIDLAHAEFEDHAGRDVKPMNPTLKSIIDAIKKPVAAAPLLAVILVLIGIKIPTSWAPTFDLIAKANAGVAVLAAGLALSTVKFSIDKEVIWNTFFRLFLTPAIIVLAAYLCGMGSEAQKISMLCLATGLPPAFSGIIIASRYNIYVKEGASSVAVSTVFFAVSCIFWIWLLPIIASVFH